VCKTVALPTELISLKFNFFW